MTNSEIARLRLHNQRVAGVSFDKPEDAVRWLGAVQAQDYVGAKWAIAQRTNGVTDAALDQAFADGTILRTHLLRPTWHLVTPADIRWMLALTAPRVKVAIASMCRKLGLDESVFARSNDALAEALQGGRQRTRAELLTVLQQTGITTNDLLHFNHLLMRAELDGIICSGGRRGNQFTYALLEERAPSASTLDRDEAVAELTRRYFFSHGPATLRDFVWWSGLTATDAKAGLDMIGSRLDHGTVDGVDYWFTSSMTAETVFVPAAYLLPNFDEYVVGYADRSAAFDARHVEHLDARGNILFNHSIVIDGRIVGTWKRTVVKNAVMIEAKPFTPLNEAEGSAVIAAANRYGAFLEMPIVQIEGL